MLYTVALLPFILILLYESVYSKLYLDRYYARITVACMLAVSMAFWI